MAGKRTWVIWRAVSLAVLLAGALLVGLMVYTEGEPGALPLAMVLAGAVGSVAAWRKSRRA